MANLNYDAVGGIEQTIPANSVGFNVGIGAVVSPLTNAAINGNASPTAAPNAFGTTGHDLSVTTAAFSVTGTNGFGQACFTATNPA
jgi:hypothetical protein